MTEIASIRVVLSTKRGAKPDEANERVENASPSETGRLKDSTLEAGLQQLSRRPHRDPR
jgi:hypothetical protein